MRTRPASEAGNGPAVLRYNPNTAATIIGDFIGTDSSADNLGNGGFGIVINGTSNNNIGIDPNAQNPAAAANHNSISRNKSGGVEISGTGATSNVVGNNDIGASNTLITDATGNGNMGVYVTNGASGNTVGVNVNGNAVKGAMNVICGNAAAGVVIDQGSQNNQVAGNLIGIRDGTDLVYGDVIPNGGYGVEIRWTTGYGATQSNLIGGTSAQERNVISANALGGVLITGAQASSNQVLGNYIGTDLGGDDALDGQGIPTGNGGDGVLIQDGSSNQIGNAPGQNVISGNAGNGVDIQYAFSVPANNKVWNNNIGTDSGGNDGSDWLPNGKNAINLTGLDAQHKITGTSVQFNKIIYVKGQHDRDFTNTANTTDANNTSVPHVPQNSGGGQNQGALVPSTLLVDSTNVEFGTQPGDSDVIGAGLEQDDGSTVIVQGTLTVNGDYDENSSMLTLQSALIAADNFNVASGALLTGVGTLTDNASGDQAFLGGLEQDGSTVTDDGAITTTGAFVETAGVMNLNSGASLSANGDYDQSGGTVSGYFSAALTAGGAANVTGGLLALYYTAGFQSVGTMTISGGGVQLEDGVIGAYQVLVQPGGVLSGSGSVNTSVINDGEVDATDYGTLSVSGSYTQTGGATNVGAVQDAVFAVSGALTEQGGTVSLNNGTLQATLDIESGASFWGYGTIDGGVTNDGSLTIGGGMSVTLYINGDFTQTGDGALTEDLSYGSYNTMLNVSGQAALDGAFILNSVDGEAPFVGVEMAPVQYGSYTGGFASLSLPAPSSGTWVEQYTSGYFQMNVESS